MGHVITVTREFGSMGRKIAQKVAENVGFHYYDRDVIELTAKEFRYDIEKLSAFEDQKISTFSKMLYPLGLGNAAMQNRLYEMEKSVILDLARSEDCVIVGRCSDYVLREAKHTDMLNVFIYAPYEQRLDNCEKLLNLSPIEAKKYVDGVDRARHEFYKGHTGQNFHSTKYRHLMLDSSVFSYQDCAKHISDIAKSKFNL